MRLVLALILILLLGSIATVAHAEDVLIIHQGYANSHLKWKNRLEDAGHTVTSVNITSASFPTDTTSYEQIYDLINLPYHLVQDYSGGAQIESATKHYLQEVVRYIFRLKIPAVVILETKVYQILLRMK